MLIAWIAVKIAWTGSTGNDSQDAALAALAQTVLGEVLLWITALGLAALALWQAFETVWRRTTGEGLLTKALGRVGSTFSAIAYLGLCVSAARVAVAEHAARDGRRTTDTTRPTEEIVLRVLIVVIARWRRPGPGAGPLHLRSRAARCWRSRSWPNSPPVLILTSRS